MTESKLHTLSSLAGGVLVPVALALAIPLTASADGPPRPPEEAYTSCQSKNAGDTCTVQFGNRQLQGICMKDPYDARLFCAPPHPPGPPPTRREATTTSKGGWEGNAAIELEKK